MKRALLLVLLIGLFQISTFAQSSPTCPKITVVGPSVAVGPNENFDFRVIISKDYDSSNLKYIWILSRGEIISGQGTPSITTSTGKANSSTATVEVQGLPTNCSNNASETFLCSHCDGIPRKTLLIDEYGKITNDEEKTRLNKFADELQSYPTVQGFIIKSFTRNINKADAYQDLQRTLNYLQSRGLNKDRIIFGVTYDKEELTRILIVPAGAAFPLFDDEILNAAQLAEKLKAIEPKPTNQLTNSSLCPTISVIGPAGTVEPANINFNAIVSKDFDSSNLKYLWKVSNGKIVSGQGTSLLTVNLESGKVLTVTVVVQGLPTNCANTASESMACSHCGMIMMPIKAEEFGKIALEKEKLRLNELANKLQNHSGAMVFITKSFTRKTSKVVYQDLQRILDYLESRGINKNRVVFTAVSGKEEQTVFFIIPPGVNFPEFEGEILDAEKLAEKLKAVKKKSPKKPTKKKSNFISH